MATRRCIRLTAASVIVGWKAIPTSSKWFRQGSKNIYLLIILMLLSPKVGVASGKCSLHNTCPHTMLLHCMHKLLIPAGCWLISHKRPFTDSNQLCEPVYSHVKSMLISQMNITSLVFNTCISKLRLTLPQVTIISEWLKMYLNSC